MVWDNQDGASFYMKGTSGDRRFSEYVVDWENWEQSDKAAPVRVTRTAAIRLLAAAWVAFLHFGDVPNYTERLEYESDFGLSSLFPPHPAAAACLSRRRGKSEG